MRRIDALLADYGSYHRTRGNLACHAAGITLILFGGLSMLSAVRIGTFGPIPHLTAAEIAATAVIAFYAGLDVPLALAMLIELAALDAAARAVSDWRAGAAAFAVGWVFQGVGHAVYEKNRPAFFKNLVHLLVGPAFLMNEIVKARPVAAAAK